MNHRAPKGQAYIPTDIEHIANVVTHGVSTALCYSVSFFSSHILSGFHALGVLFCTQARLDHGLADFYAMMWCQ